MPLISVAWFLARARLRATWRLLVPVALGMLVAVTLLASAPQYAGVLNDLGLRYTLQREPPARGDVVLQSASRPTVQGEYTTQQDTLRRQVDTALGNVVTPPTRYAKSAVFFMYRNGENIAATGQTSNAQPRGYVQFADGVNDKVAILSGSWPPAGQGLQALAGQDAATELGIRVGDTIRMVPAAGGTPVEVTIAATGAPVDSTDRFWSLGAVRLSENARDWVVLPLIVDEASYFTAAQPVVSDYTTRWPTDLTRLTTANAGAARDGVTRLRSTLAGSGVTIATSLDTILNDYLGKLATTEIPLYLLLLQVVALVLFYLVLVSNVVVERQMGEIALLKSRGASGLQVLTIFAAEGGALALAAVLIGPPLATLLTTILINLPGSPLAGAPAVRLGWESWLLAVSAAMLALLALLWPAARAANHSIVLYRRQAARAGGQPFWQRMYLDVILLVVGGAGVWAAQRQAFLAGSDGLDPLLLVSPALLALAVSFALLRLMPIVLRLAARVLNNTSVILALALQQLSRRPGASTRLLLLLTLTTSLGLFAATFRGTIDRSYEDRTAYRVGADARIDGITSGNGQPKARILTTLSGEQGVRQIATAYRTTGQVGPASANRRYQFLAVDAAQASVIWSRSDFNGGQSPAQLLTPLNEAAAAVEAPTLPPGGEAVGLLVRPLNLLPNVAMTIRLTDADGQLIDVELGRLDFGDWRQLDGPLPSNVRAPLRLTSVYFTQQGGVGEIGAASVLIDDLSIREPGGIRRIVEPFDTVGAWSIIRDGIADSNDVIERVTADTRSGTPALRFRWSPRRVFGTRGIQLQETTPPLPVLASPNYLAASTRNVGDTLPLPIGDRTVQAVIMGTVDYFATLDPADTGFVVAALDPTIARLNAVPGRPIYPNEAWISLDPGTNTAPIRQKAIESLGAQSLVNRSALVGEASNDPLVAAGFAGVLSLAFIAALGLSLLGFVSQSGLDLERRLVELAVLRTMGLSLRQMVSILALEQAVVVITGIIVGTALGLQIGALMLPLLELTERGGRVLPPFVITTQWPTVFPSYILLGLLFVAVIGTTGFILARLNIGRTLRIGE